jgi:chromate transporter
MASPGPAARPSLRRLAAVFAWVGLTSLGGGRSAYFYDAVVARRGWLRTGEFLQDLALAQVLPGPTFSNLAVALGQRLGGRAGAFWALLAVVGPGAVLLLGLTVLYGRGWLGPGLERPLRWMAAAVVGLVLVTTGRMLRAGLRGGGPALVLAAATCAAVGLLRLPAFVVIPAMAALGLWLHRPRGGTAAP